MLFFLGKNLFHLFFRRFQIMILYYLFFKTFFTGNDYIERTRQHHGKFGWENSKNCQRIEKYCVQRVIYWGDKCCKFYWCYLRNFFHLVKCKTWGKKMVNSNKERTRLIFIEKKKMLYIFYWNSWMFSLYHKKFDRKESKNIESW